MRSADEIWGFWGFRITRNPSCTSQGFYSFGMPCNPDLIRAAPQTMSIFAA